MQIVLERGSIDKLLTFNIGLLQLIFHTNIFINLIHMHAKVFTIQIFQYLRQIPQRVYNSVLFIVKVKGINFYMPSCPERGREGEGGGGGGGGG